jgi:hypothetical protein
MQYKATQPIKHNGSTHAPGQLLDLTTKEAQQLIELGAVEPVDVPFARKLDTPWGDQP